VLSYQRRGVAVLIVIGIVLLAGLLLLLNWDAGPTCLELEETMNVICST